MDLKLCDWCGLPLDSKYHITLSIDINLENINKVSEFFQGSKTAPAPKFEKLEICQNCQKAKKRLELRRKKSAEKLSLKYVDIFAIYEENK